MAEHTPIPWKTPAPDMITCSMGNIAHVYCPDKYTTGDQAANAEFIVQAVNAHDKLAEACERLCKVADRLKNTETHSKHDPRCPMCAAVKAARAALEPTP